MHTIDELTILADEDADECPNTPLKVIARPSGVNCILRLSIGSFEGLSFADDSLNAMTGRCVSGSGCLAGMGGRGFELRSRYFAVRSL